MIDSGVRLTITADIYVLYPDVKFIVKSGGQLIISGGSIQSGRFGTWKGIEVYGKPDQAQSIASHGLVSIYGNSVISDAEIAIRVGYPQSPEGNPDSLDVNGGIVFVRNTVFKNNKIAILFEPYRYYNMSYISQSSFITDNLTTSFDDPESFIVLNDVIGLRIQGCEFENTVPAFNFGTIAQNIGIESNNSHFYVEEIITGSFPDIDTSYCTFKFLNYGIKALAYSTDRTLRVDSSKFNNNKCGIYLCGIINATIRRNEFNSYQADTLYFADTTAGLYLDACTGFQAYPEQITGRTVHH